MPTGHVFIWHCLAITQPNDTRAEVPKSYSSAPKIAAKIISLAHFSPPSTLNVTYSLNPFATRVWCVSANPYSHGKPACFCEPSGVAPVPPSEPEIRIILAPALATPAAITPTPG